MKPSDIFWLLVVGLIFLGAIYLAVRPNEAEWRHCLATSLDADKAICESLNPHK